MMGANLSYKVFLIFIMICVTLSCIVFFAPTIANVPASTRNDEISVSINSKEIVFDQEPIIKNGRTLVPIRPVCEALGADVYWNDEARTVVIVRNKTKVLLKIGENSFTLINTSQDEKALNDLIDGNASNQVEEKELDCAPEIISGRTVIPIRAVCEALGADVKWNGNDNSITIKATNIKKNTNKTFYDDFCDIFVDARNKEKLSILTSQKWHIPRWKKKEHGNIKLYAPKKRDVDEGGICEIYDCYTTTFDYCFNDDYTYEYTMDDIEDYVYYGTYEFDGNILRLHGDFGGVYSYDADQNVFVSKGTERLTPNGDVLGDTYLIPYENMVSPAEAVELLKVHLEDVYCFNFWDSFDDELYYIQHYEDMETHTATAGWYYVNKWTKEVISGFLWMQ